jgi:hypothetical protein
MGQVRTWICGDCGHKARRTTSPGPCPGCGADAVVRQDSAARALRQRRKERRWPLEPLLDATGLTASALRREIAGFPGGVQYLTDELADRAAVRCGLHPAMVWGWEWVTVGLMHPVTVEDIFANLRVHRDSAA